VATLEERVSFLEGRVVEQSNRLDGVREAVVSLEQRFDQRFVSLEQRIVSLEDRMDRRFDGVDRQFKWLVGLQVTTLVAMVAALLAR